MQERVLVTGAGGFLGSHICQYFGSRGHAIAAVGRFDGSYDIMDVYPGLAKLCGLTLPDAAFVTAVRDFQPTLLVHCAGTSSVPNSVSDPYKDFQDTVEVCAFTLEVLRKQAPRCRFILLSSAAVYGNPADLPIGEDAPRIPISPYGYHKRLCELLVEEHQALYSTPTAILRIFSAYGERLRKQVVFDLCRKFAAPDTETVEIYGTGDESRDFIHAADVAQAIDRIHASGASGIFNVASGVQTSIKDLADLIRSCTASSKSMRYTGEVRTGDPLCWQADIGRLSALGFNQQIDLPSGVMNYCRWFASQFGK